VPPSEGFSMGDLRNKIGKQYQFEDEMRRRRARSGSYNHLPDYRCEVCQRSHYEVTVYEVKTDMKRLSSPTLLFCEEHLPDWDGPGWKQKP
jgi:hypothetical protein